MYNYRIIIHWNGFAYYYTTETGVQVSKMYRKLHNLKKYGK